MSAMEKNFQSELAASSRRLAEVIGSGVWYHKIPDNPKGAGSNLGTSNPFRFMCIKGYDCYLVVLGHHIAIECKMTHKLSVAFDALRNEQEMALFDVLAAGGTAYVVVCYRVDLGKAEAKKMGQERIIEAYAIPVKSWRKAKMEATRASFTRDWVVENAIQIPWLGEGIWDLEPLVKLPPFTPFLLPT